MVEDGNAYKRFAFTTACEREVFNWMMIKAASSDNLSLVGLVAAVRRYNPAPRTVDDPPLESPSREREPEPPKTNPCWPDDCMHDKSW